MGLTLLDGRWDQLKQRIMNKLGTHSAYLPLLLHSDDPSEVAQHEHELALFDKVCELLRWSRCMLHHTVVASYTARARDVSATRSQLLWPQHSVTVSQLMCCSNGMCRPVCDLQAWYGPVESEVKRSRKADESPVNLSQFTRFAFNHQRSELYSELVCIMLPRTLYAPLYCVYTHSTSASVCHPGMEPRGR